MADHGSGTQPVTFTQALPLAIGDAQRLFGGTEGRRRWRSLALTAVMAGAVGVGVQPPPLGLLHPVWSDPATRDTALQSVRPLMPLLALLTVMLIGFAIWARSFALALIESLLRPHPQPLSCEERGAAKVARSAENPASYRGYVKAGAAHFVWSACWSVPLYALLFAMEAGTTQASWERILRASEAEVGPLLIQALLGFVAVLFPWIVLSLPMMVFQYELTPVVMVRRGTGPLAASREVFRRVRTCPNVFAGYYVGRTLLQFIGAGLMTAAAVPCLLVSALLASPILAGGGILSSLSGGWNTGVGAALGSATILLSCAVFYCVICVVLLPLTAVPFLLADRMLGFRD